MFEIMQKVYIYIYIYIYIYNIKKYKIIPWELISKQKLIIGSRISSVGDVITAIKMLTLWTRMPKILQRFHAKEKYQNSRTFKF